MWGDEQIPPNTPSGPSHMLHHCSGFQTTSTQSDYSVLRHQGYKCESDTVRAH